MKFLIILITFSQLVFAEDECRMRSASALTNERNVGPVADLVTEAEEGICNVSYTITIDGHEHYVTGSYKGLEQTASLCHQAIINSRNNLLVQLGGNFETEAVTVCKEGEEDLADDIQIGDTILETEVGRSKMNKYFEYQNARCRMFTQKMSKNRQLRVFNGVICQVDNSDANWIVVDKW